MWHAYLKGFKAYMQLERSLSDNTVEAYLHDVDLLAAFMKASYGGVGLESVEISHLHSIIHL